MEIMGMLMINYHHVHDVHDVYDDFDDFDDFDDHDLPLNNSLQSNATKTKVL